MRTAWLLTGLWLCLAAVAAAQPAALNIEPLKVLEDFPGDYCWFHPRAAAVPREGGPPLVIMTLQKHLMSASDYYSGLYEMRSEDGGNTWTGPDAIPSLGWRDEGGGVTWAVCDVTPGWHAPSGTLLAIGIAVRYVDGKQQPAPSPRETAYAVYDPAANAWGAWEILETPGTGLFFATGAGCTQWAVKEDGSLLVPVYGWSREQDTSSSATATVLHCRFDGESMTYLEHGDELTIGEPRGFCEPSIIEYEGRYYLTLRNDERGYVTRGEDGLHFETSRPWTFDDGTELGSYNTQQHWLTHAGALYLVYTRRGADNDDIFRHRAPLFIARVDPERLCVLRETERVAVPNRGATLGNFGAVRISDEECWVTVAEGMFFPDVYRRHGATGAIWVSRIR